MFRTEQKNYENAIADLEFFLKKMVESKKNNQLTEEEFNDICVGTNSIVTHITNGNAIEKEVTDIMGGEIYELSSDRIKRETREEDCAIYEPIIAEKDRSIAEKDREIALLREQLAAARAQ